MRDFVKLIEDQEIIDKLIDNGYGLLVMVLLDDQVYTKGGRMKKSAVCRRLRCKVPYLEGMLREAKELFEP